MVAELIARSVKDVDATSKRTNRNSSLCSTCTFFLQGLWGIQCLQALMQSTFRFIVVNFAAPVGDRGRATMKCSKTARGDPTSVPNSKVRDWISAACASAASCGDLLQWDRCRIG